MSQREAAAKKGGVSDGAGSRQRRKVRVLLENERRLRRMVARAEARMQALRQAMSQPQRGREVSK